jgi:hypothetical protein
MFAKKVLLFDESGAGGGSASAPDSDKSAQGDGDLTFEKFVESLDDKAKGLLEVHTKGLKSALKSEREIREGFEKQIKELAAKAEKGSELEKQLTELSAKADGENKRAAFYENAHTAGITNLKLAFLVATTDSLFDEKGNVDFAALKTKYPELFTKPIPTGNAGEGANELQPAPSMNDAIRRMAGRKS